MCVVVNLWLRCDYSWYYDLSFTEVYSRPHETVIDYDNKSLGYIVWFFFFKKVIKFVKLKIVHSDIAVCLHSQVISCQQETW